MLPFTGINAISFQSGFSVKPRAGVTEEVARGARQVLTAAALTYVAALLMSVVQLLRYVMLFTGRRGDRR